MDFINLIESCGGSNPLEYVAFLWTMMFFKTGDLMS